MKLVGPLATRDARSHVHLRLSHSNSAALNIPALSTSRLLALLRLKQPAVRGQALAGVACRRRQKKYETPHSTPVAGAHPHAPRPSPPPQGAMSAETRGLAQEAAAP